LVDSNKLEGQNAPDWEDVFSPGDLADATVDVGPEENHRVTILHLPTGKILYDKTLQVPGVEADGYGYDWMLAWCKAVDPCTAIDPTDNTFTYTPYMDSRDIIAVYYMETDDYVCFRLDFLDLSYQAEEQTADHGDNLNVYIALDFAPGGQIWFPDFTNTQTAYPWERCIAIYDTENYHVYAPDWGDLTAPENFGKVLKVAFNSQNDLLEVKVPRRVLGYPKGTVVNLQFATTVGAYRPPGSALYDICPNDNLADGVYNTAIPSTASCRTAKVAIVHHGNQGLGNPSSVVAHPWEPNRGYYRIIQTHKEIKELYGVWVPVGLHVSGTLTPALQWWAPDFVRDIRYVTKRMVIGGIGTEHIVPMFDWVINDNAIAIRMEMNQRIFGCTPRVTWVPERTWENMENCRNIIAKWYEGVILDCGETTLGQAVSVGSAIGEHHWDYCTCGNYHQVHKHATFPDFQDNLYVWFSCWDMREKFIQSFDGGPHMDCRKHWNYLANSPNQRQLCMYMDDWEKAAGDPLDAWGWIDPTNYEITTKWIAQHPWIQVTTPEIIHREWRDWLDPSVNTSMITNYSCAWDEYVWLKSWIIPVRTSGRGQGGWYGDWYDGYGGPEGYRESYRHWKGDYIGTPNNKEMGAWNAPGTWIGDAYQALVNAPNNEFRRLAWYVFLTMLYETAWHEGDAIAGWERTIMPHVRKTRVYTFAASWLDNVRKGYVTQARAFLTDVDDDNDNEVVMYNDKLLAIFEKRGARAFYIFDSNGKAHVGCAPPANPWGRLDAKGPAAFTDSWVTQDTVPPVIVDFYDPPNDDYGPGTYTYPYPNDNFSENNVFDLRGLTLTADAENINFVIKFENLGGNRWNKPNGFCLQVINILVDNQAGGARNGDAPYQWSYRAWPVIAIRDPWNNVIGFNFQWDFALYVSGTDNKLFRVDGPTEKIRVEADQANNRVIVRVPRRFLGNPTFDYIKENWKILTFVGGFEGRDPGTPWDPWKTSTQFVWKPEFAVNFWAKTYADSLDGGKFYVAGVKPDGSLTWWADWSLWRGENQDWEANGLENWAEVRIPLYWLGAGIGDNIKIFMHFRPAEDKPGIAGSAPFDSAATSNYANLPADGGAGNAAKITQYASYVLIPNGLSPIIDGRRDALWNDPRVLVVRGDNKLLGTVNAGFEPPCQEFRVTNDNQYLYIGWPANGDPWEESPSDNSAHYCFFIDVTDNHEWGFWRQVDNVGSVWTGGGARRVAWNAGNNPFIYDVIYPQWGVQEEYLYNYNDYRWVELGGLAVSDYNGRGYDTHLYYPTVDLASGQRVQVTFSASENQRIRSKTFSLSMGSPQLEVQYQVEFDNRWQKIGALTPRTIGLAAGGKGADGSPLYFCMEKGATSFFAYDPYRDLWYSLADAPVACQAGVSMAYAENGGKGYIYLTSADSNLYRYAIDRNVWETLASLPSGSFGPGTGLAWLGDNNLWCLQGGTSNLWRYNLIENTWSLVSTAPFTASVGGGLVNVPADNSKLYAFVGGSSTGFWSYSIRENSWRRLADAPRPVQAGSSYAGFSYNPSGNIPGTYASFIFAIFGENENSFWQYLVSQNSWFGLENLPTDPDPPTPTDLAITDNSIDLTSDPPFPVIDGIRDPCWDNAQVVENDGGWRQPGDFATQLYFMNDDKNLYFGFPFFGDPWNDGLSAHYYLAIETKRDGAGTRRDNWHPSENDYIKWPYAPDYWIQGWVNQSINPETFGDLVLAVSDGVGGFRSVTSIPTDNWKASRTNRWCEIRLAMSALGLKPGDNFDVILLFRPDETKPGIADCLPFDESTSDWANGTDDYIYAKQTFTVMQPYIFSFPTIDGIRDPCWDNAQVVENDGGWRQPGDFATQLYFMNDDKNLYFGFPFFGDPWNDGLSAHYYLAIETKRDGAGTRRDNWHPSENDYIKWPYAPDYWIQGWVNQSINPETFGDLVLAVSDGVGGFRSVTSIPTDNWKASRTNRWCEIRLAMSALGLKPGDNFDVILLFRPDETKPGIADCLPFDESTSDWANGTDDYIYAKQTFTVLPWTPPQWYMLESWSGTASAPVTWQGVDSWTLACEAPAGWSSIDSLTGTLQTLASWNTNDSWTCTIKTSAGWTLIETCSGTGQATVSWFVTDSWGEETRAPAYWLQLESWSATVGTPPSPPTLILPDNNASTTATPTFQWDNTSPLDNFRLEVDNDADFSSPEDNLTFPSTTKSWTKPAPGYAIDNYYWRIWAINQFGMTCSEVRVFQVTQAFPTSPVLLSPENNTTLILPITFTWKRGNYADNHRIEIDNDPDFSSPEENVWRLPPDDNWYTSTMLDYGTYYWRVWAVNSLGENVSENTWIFTLIPVWRQLESWSCSAGSAAQWCQVEAWREDGEATAVWWVTDSWTETVQSPACWVPCEEWSCQIRAPVTGWSQLDTWTSTCHAVASWTVMEGWTGTVRAPLTGLPSLNRLVNFGNYLYLASGREDNLLLRYFLWNYTIYIKNALSPDLHNLILDGRAYLREEKSGARYLLWNDRSRSAVGFICKDTGFSSEYADTLHYMVELYHNGVGLENFSFTLIIL
jgi:hypothetical protein